MNEELNQIKAERTEPGKWFYWFSVVLFFLLLLNYLSVNFKWFMPVYHELGSGKSVTTMILVLGGLIARVFLLVSFTIFVMRRYRLKHFFIPLVLFSSEIIGTLSVSGNVYNRLTILASLLIVTYSLLVIKDKVKQWFNERPSKFWRFIMFVIFIGVMFLVNVLNFLAVT